MVTQVATGGAVEVGSLGRAEEGLVSTGQMDLGVGKTGDSPQASGKSVEPLVTPAREGGSGASRRSCVRLGCVLPRGAGVPSPSQTAAPPPGPSWAPRLCPKPLL